MRRSHIFLLSFECRALESWSPAVLGWPSNWNYIVNFRRGRWPSSFSGGLYRTDKVQLRCMHVISHMQDYSSWSHSTPNLTWLNMWPIKLYPIHISDHGLAHFVQGQCFRSTSEKIRLNMIYFPPRISSIIRSANGWQTLASQSNRKKWASRCDTLKSMEETK